LALPKKMKNANFDGKIVSATAGRMHSAVVTDKGTLCIWGILNGTADDSTSQTRFQQWC